MSDSLQFLTAAALVARNVANTVPPARLVVGAVSGGDPMIAAARISGLLAAFSPQMRLLSPLSTDVALVTLNAAAYSGDVGAAFELAQALREASGAAEVEPELPYSPNIEPPAGAHKDAAPSTRESTTSAGCWAGEDPPLAATPRWAPEMIKAPAAWAMSRAAGRPVAGAGIVIAHLDTGITNHAELQGTNILPGIDLIEGDFDPTDPLGYAGNPGHGTSTASVIISGRSGGVMGVAPSASMLPIRCIASVIVLLSGTVAQAIDSAVASGAHVITMSLGGLSSFALERALARAVAADVIVLAAAGNCVGWVTYPAADPNCLAIGGVNARSMPWRGSCHGPEVDVSAPAENVFRAIAGPAGSGATGQSEGTSYAVALTAGAAACWLAHHGRARAIEAARRRGMTLQALFRQVLTNTARQPAGWSPQGLGTGIVDMEALLRADLSTGRREAGTGMAAAQTNAGRVRNLLLAIAENPSDALASAPVHAVRSELVAHVMLSGSRKPGAAASPALTQAVGQEGLKALGLAATDDAPYPATPALVAPLAPAASAREDHVRSIRRQFAAKGRSGLESLARESVPDDAALPPVDVALGQFDPDNVDAFIDRFPAGEVANREEMKRALLATWRIGRRGYSKLTDPAKIGSVTRGEHAALEAVVNIDGSSPTLLLRNNVVDIQHPLVGAWESQLFLANSNLFTKVAPAIGRIQLAGGGPGAFFGTGTLVARSNPSDPPLALTNYHVLDAFLPYTAFRKSGNRIRIINGPVIDFDGEIDKPIIPSHKIVAARLPEGAGATDSTLDAVALEIEPLQQADAALPPPVSLLKDPGMALGGSGKLVVIGFPAQPERTSGIADDVDWGWVTSVLFGNRFGYKRVAPGVTRLRSGGLGANRHPSVFTHDATTLGGSSGSLIFGFDTGTGAFGLHFAGLTRERNEAHAIGLVADQLRAIGLAVD